MSQENVEVVRRVYEEVSAGPSGLSTTRIGSPRTRTQIANAASSARCSRRRSTQCSTPNWRVWKPPSSRLP